MSGLIAFIGFYPHVSLDPDPEIKYGVCPVLNLPKSSGKINRNRAIVQGNSGATVVPAESNSALKCKTHSSALKMYAINHDQSPDNFAPELTCARGRDRWKQGEAFARWVRGGSHHAGECFTPTDGMLYNQGLSEV